MASTPAELFPFDPTEPLERLIKSGLHNVFKKYASCRKWSAEEVKAYIVDALHLTADVNGTYQAPPSCQPPLKTAGCKYISSLMHRFVSIQVDKSGLHRTFHRIPEIDRLNYKQYAREFHSNDFKSFINGECEDLKSNGEGDDVVYAVWKGLLELFTRAEAAHGQVLDTWFAKLEYLQKLGDMWNNLSVKTLQKEDNGAYCKWMDETWFDEQQQREEEEEEEEEGNALR